MDENRIFDTTLLCPSCRSRLDVDPVAATCKSCGSRFAVENNIVDLIGTPDQSTGGQQYMESPDIIRKYQEVTRRTFIRVMGKNWDNALNYDQEDQHLLSALEGAKGPILDIACGAGRWTAGIRNKFGAHAVIGLDLSLAMLRTCRSVLPDISLVRASALALPFENGSMGAVVCWNALQLISDPALALKEVSRVLSGGGVFAGFTYRRSPNKLYEHFQTQFAQALSCRTFSDSEIVTLGREAGLTDVVTSGPECLLLVTARKRP